MNYPTRLLLILGLLIGILFGCQSSKRSETRILVFSKTAGWRHGSISAGMELLSEIATEKGWKIEQTEDAGYFTEDSLKRYSAVIFLSTTGDVLNHIQQADFERYIQGGGGYVGIHAASDTEYDWPWYGKLVGAYFNGHPNNPNVRKGTFRILNTEHPSTRFLQGRTTWEREDEFYNFKSIYHGEPDGIIPLIDIDETSYEGGTNGDFHPMTWYHEFDGGRAWYTNFGHADRSFAEPDFKTLLIGGIEYAIGENQKIQYQKARSQRVPPAYRFKREVLASGLNEPTGMAILDDNRILWTQRRGNLMMFDPTTQQSRQVGTLAVWDKFEDGLVGIAPDPDFKENHWLYLYYSPANSEPQFQLSRFTFQDDTLLLDTEQKIMTVPVQRDTCCHTGGSIVFGPDGLLYLSTGDDTNPFETRYAPIDNRMGKDAWDARRSSGNPSDLRGKILRIRVLADGSYEIPSDNLFDPSGKEGRPEIYVMGCRNPYRISIDTETNFLYWGDVGPDAQVDSSRGPRGYDEVNQARKAGFFGWPYFIGNNYAYAAVDFHTNTLGERFDAAQPVNDSRHNSGTQQLPPAQPPLVWYPYTKSPDFPIVEKGGRNAMAGPVYHLEEFEGSPNAFPAYFDDKLFFYDFMRDWVLLATLDSGGDLEGISPFLDKDHLNLSSPMDMKFGPDGSLYVLSYGTKWFTENPDAELIKITYSEKNQPPVGVISADKTVGIAPLSVRFSGQKSRDEDPQETLSYQWKFPDGSTQEGLETQFTFRQTGKNTVTLLVMDAAGNQSEEKLDIWVGNSPPEVSVELEGNQEFFWQGRALSYQVKVKDAEDGIRTEGTDGLSVSWNWIPNAYDPTEAAAGHQELASATSAEALIQANGCFACHAMDSAIIGPGYLQVAQRYRGDRRSRDYLAAKIQKGGSGNWGGQAMPAMTQVTATQARQIAEYILDLGKKKSTLPARGELATTKHSDFGEGGIYELRATYQDLAINKIGPLRGESVAVLRAPVFTLSSHMDRTLSHKAYLEGGPKRRNVKLEAQGMYVSRPIDLTQVIEMRMGFMAGKSSVEVRLDDKEGQLIGELNPREGKNSLTLSEKIEGKHRLCFVSPNSATSPTLLGKVELTFQ